jgi:DNA-binding NarL/FixJ family response regulator
MDIRMPGLDGITATRKLAENGSRTKILILTTFDHDEYLYAAMRSGASGFLVKDVRRAELVEAIRSVAAGDSLLAPRLLKRLVEAFCAAPPPTAGVPAVLASLTERKVEILRLVAMGLSNSEIAQKLFLSHATIKTHIAHLNKKRGLRDRVSAVVLAYESGLVRPGSTPGLR